jgi:hypothetical protein
METDKGERWNGAWENVTDSWPMKLNAQWTTLTTVKYLWGYLACRILRVYQFTVQKPPSAKISNRSHQHNTPINCNEIQWNVEPQIHPKQQLPTWRIYNWPILSQTRSYHIISYLLHPCGYIRENIRISQIYIS